MKVLEPQAETKDKSLGVDSRAVIHPSAKIADDVEIGPWTSIGPNVEIGSGTKIHSHVVIAKDTKIGKNNRIYSFAAIGGDTQDLVYAGEDTYLEIGDNNVFREFCTINRGSPVGIGTTTIGNDCNFLAYSHVAHDCIIGNNVLFVNNASLAGHVVVYDNAILSAFTAVHQFCHIGSYTFICRAAQVAKDVPPYMLVAGPSDTPSGLNLIGLKRCGFSMKVIRGLKKAFHLIYGGHLKLAEVKVQLELLTKETPEVQLILDFIKQSERGIAR